MSESIKFYKGLESSLPELKQSNEIEIGALYHCTDTKNTYIGIRSNELQLWNTGVVYQQLNGGAAIGEGEALGQGSFIAGYIDSEELDKITAYKPEVDTDPPIAYSDGSLAFGIGAKAHSMGSVAMGISNTAGAKGFYWHSIDWSGANPVIQLSIEQKPYRYYKILGQKIEQNKTPNWTTDAANILANWSSGDTLTLVNVHKYGERAIITHVDSANGKITVQSLPFTQNDVKVEFTSLSDISNLILMFDDFSIYNTKKLGDGVVEFAYGALSLGLMTNAAGSFATALGYNTKVITDFGHTEGRDTVAGYAAHAEGEGTEARSRYQHAQGRWNIPDPEGKYAHIVGNGTGNDNRRNIHTVDWTGTGEFANHIIGGTGNTTINSASTVLMTGKNNIVVGNNGSAIGFNNQVYGHAGQAEGHSNIVGQGTSPNGTDFGYAAHAGGKDSVAEGNQAFAHGLKAKALGNTSIALGQNVQALTDNSVAIGKNTTAGLTAIEETWYGYNLAAGFHLDMSGLSIQEIDDETLEITSNNVFIFDINGNIIKEFRQGAQIDQTDQSDYSDDSLYASTYDLYKIGNGEMSPISVTIYNTNAYAEGEGTIAYGKNQHVQGKYNISDSLNKYALIVGNGNSDENRSNAYTLDWDGNAEFAGTISASNITTLESDIKNMSQNIDDHSTRLQNLEVGQNGVGRNVGKHNEIFNDYENNTVVSGMDYAAIHGTKNTGGNFAFIGGINNNGSAKAAFIAGDSNIVLGNNGSARGYNTKAYGHASHVEGHSTEAGQSIYPNGTNYGYAAHAEGKETKAISNFSHTEGLGTVANNQAQHVSGKYNKYENDDGSELNVAFTIGNGSSNDVRSNAMTVDWSGNGVFQGCIKAPTAQIGDFNTFTGTNTLAIGSSNTVSGTATIAVGDNQVINGLRLCSIGKDNTINTNNSITIGVNNKNYGHCGYVEGHSNELGGSDRPNDSQYATMSHVEGRGNKVFGSYMHVEGYYNQANQQRLWNEHHGMSHIEGHHNICEHTNQHIEGYYNVAGDYLHIVGNGTSDENRSNAYTLDRSGNGVFKGYVTTQGLILSAGYGSSLPSSGTQGQIFFLI